jgi:hypothetical protein
MAKLTLFDLSSGSFTVDLLNANFALIETALENTLSRDGTAPNSMSASLDMNSNRILNLPTAATNNEPVTLGQLLALGTLNLYTPSNHVHAWTDITDKPTTFTPSAHTHVKADVTDLVSDLASLDTRLDTIEAEPTIYVQSGTPTALNHPTMQSLWFW